MAERSAGLLLYRCGAGDRRAVEVLLVHPGGPFWARRDIAAWSIPKGLIDAGEDPLAAARREFGEETGAAPPSAQPLRLGEFRQSSAKIVIAYAVEGNFDVTRLQSNTFTMEWPPHSGQKAEFPEADRAAWFGMDEAREKIHKGQVPILDALSVALSTPPATRR